MAERDGMTDLIGFVARLAGDPAHEIHGREDVQDALDAYRREWRYVPLVGVPTRSPGGVAYLAYDAAALHWEAGATFHDAAQAAILPATSDWAAGRWTFATEPTAPVVILGYNHDPYQAAADLLEIRAAQTAEEYDFTTGPDSYKRSQKHKQLLALAERYRAMSPRLKAEAKAATDWTMPEIEVDVLPY